MPIYYTYPKEFAVKFKNNTKVAYMDDNATVPIGEPFNSVSMAVCGHNESPRAVDRCTGALNHDWKLGGLILPVSLTCDIPESTKHTFFTGVPFVTTKKGI